MANLSNSRQYMEHRILMWLHNDQITHEICTDTAEQAAQAHVTDEPTRPDHEVHHAAGEAVAGQLIDWIERIGERAGHGSSGEGPAATMLGMLKDLLDVGDSQLWTSIGEDFLSDWERPKVCKAADCEELATDDNGHCDDCGDLLD